MKILYINRNFQFATVSTHAPGDIYSHPSWGECRRLTAKRFCLMAERAGKKSDAFQGLLSAICDIAENGVYDGRAVSDWYGLVGLKEPTIEESTLEYGVCSRCKRGYWYGIPELRTLCFDCWVGPLYAP